MRIRFHRNADGEPHTYDHAVSEEEVFEALKEPLTETGGRDGSTLFIGRTRAGRVLKIIFTDARDGDGIFVVTAYDLPAKQLRTVRRRMKRRRP